MSDTPRTDAEPTYKAGIAQTRTVNIAFARQLERELVAAKKDSERLLFLMDQSGMFYLDGYEYHIIGRLRNYIDAAMKEGGK